MLCVRRAKAEDRGEKSGGMLRERWRDYDTSQVGLEMRRAEKE